MSDRAHEAATGTDSVLQTEFPFTLPQGYVDEAGDRHREGTMRLATAADEIKPLRDPRVKANPSYLSVILFSRVVTGLGGVEDVTPQTIENLYVADLAHLQSLYERVNRRGTDAVDATCPECGETFELHLGGDLDGESVPVAANPEETPEIPNPDADGGFDPGNSNTPGG